MSLLFISVGCAPACTKSAPSVEQNANQSNAASTLKAQRKVIVFLGDSLTAGYGLKEKESYPALVQQRLDDQKIPWEVVNAGVSGDTTRGGLERVPWILKLKPDAVFVALGANDGLRGLSTASAEENLVKIIATLKAQNVVVYLAGMRLPLNYGAGRGADFEKMFERVSKTNDLPLLPFLLKDVALEGGKNQGDGIHPNLEGSKIIAQLVFDFLRPLLESQGEQ